MNKVQILAKIKRNLDQLGIANTADSVSVTAVGTIISCVDAAIQAPMGGIDGSVSPFLGIGIAAPGQLQLKGASGENSLAAIFTTEDNFKVLREICGFANDVVIVKGDNTDILATLPGNADLKMMGQ
jgi:hypothetical protein